MMALDALRSRAADGKRVSNAVKEPRSQVRTQLELPNEVAAELAGPGDLVMKTLEDHLDREVYLRGNAERWTGPRTRSAWGGP